MRRISAQSDMLIERTRLQTERYNNPVCLLFQLAWMEGNVGMQREMLDQGFQDLIGRSLNSTDDFQHSNNRSLGSSHNGTINSRKEIATGPIHPKFFKPSPRRFSDEFQHGLKISDAIDDSLSDTMHADPPSSIVHSSGRKLLNTASGTYKFPVTKQSVTSNYMIDTSTQTSDEQFETNSIQHYW